MSATIKAAILALKGRIADAYTAISAKGGTLPATQDSANLPTAIASIPSGGGYDFSGYLLAGDIPISDFQDFIAQRVNLVKITDNGIYDIIGYHQFYGGSLKEATFNALTNLSGTFVFHGSPIETINLPVLQRITGNEVFYATIYLKNIYTPILENLPPFFVENCDSLVEYDGNSVLTVSYNAIYNCAKLEVVKLNGTTNIASAGIASNNPCIIDLQIGRAMTDSFSINGWSPSTALSSSSSSLVHEGETFANNLEKLLYNIREHIAANLPDRTGLSSLTITFSAAVKAAINADAATAAAFTNKNWTIA